MNCRFILLAAACLAISVATTQAQVTAPSTYTTAIQVQGEAEGTEFDDWASAGIPIATTDDADNVGFIDVNTIQIANDSENIYLRVTLHNADPVNLSSGFFLAFDTDQNATTGFDIFSLGMAGSELGYQYDYPFQQDTGVFNTGVEGVVEYGGDMIGLAVTFPYWGNPAAPMDTQAEWAIPIDIAYGPTAPGTPVFTSDSFNLLVYSDQGAGDVTEVISYTLAASPVVPGDANEDGMVDLLDLDILGTNFGTTSGATWNDGDFDSNGTVDLLDLDILGANFGAGAPSAVPEPATALWSLLAIGCLSATGRSNRK